MKHSKIDLFKAVLIISSVTLLTTFFSCCATNETDKSAQKVKSKTEKTEYFQMLKPAVQQTIVAGESVEVELKQLKTAETDSIKVTYQNISLDIEQKSKLTYRITTPSDKFGQLRIPITIYHSDSLQEIKILRILNLPKESPSIINFKLIRSIAHDPGAYTQGLFYHKGFLYESTGKEGRSSVRCLDPKDGKILRKKDLDAAYFGEGIALHNNEIYMLTYKSQLVFVFDLETFEHKRNYTLQTREGWGLTSYKNNFIASDGSANLYFFEPEYFTLVNQIEVCNNKGLVNYLNEMEYTPYGLFANIYGEDYIVLIDVETGIVKGIADLSSLFPKNLPKDIDHVLNGIAYNPDSKTFYITGKWWPIMYEISFMLD